MKFGVVVFPGSNCDHDVEYVLSSVMGAEVYMLWHKETSLDGFSTDDCIVLPGGFSYGDYLRAGAIARFSPIMQSIIRFAQDGGYVFGICNGFQILCESHLLPGALVRNSNQHFISKSIALKTCTQNSALTGHIPEGSIVKMPVAHAEGRFIIGDDGLQKLEANDQILFRYCNEEGNVTDAANINGSVENIAGICSEGRNVFGMMPHPERASESALGEKSGKMLFDSLMMSRSTIGV
jgi:phosphoribosylformylglycinamidine synthase subunit PurQ / glutaminase